MTRVTITNLRARLGYYLKLSQKEDIYITKYGRVIAVLTKPKNTSIG